MKTNYKLKIVLIAFVLGVFANVTVANKPIQIEINTNNSDSWVAVHNQKGIKVTCIPFELNGVSYLKVKFENTTNQTIDFSWTLNEGNEMVVNEKTYSVKANSFIETDNTLLISQNNNSTQADYLFNIQLK